MEHQHQPQEQLETSLVYPDIAEQSEQSPAHPSLSAEEEVWLRQQAFHLKRNNLIRRIALGFLSSRELTRTDAFNLLAILNFPSSLRWRERQVAAWILGQAC